MNALVYQGPNSISVEERPRPKLEQPSDTVVKMVKTTICGTDLHILKGDVPTCVPGRILGHEGTGVIEEVGTAVSHFKKGDRVIISCISSCGKCEHCKTGMYSVALRLLSRWLYRAESRGAHPCRTTQRLRSASAIFLCPSNVSTAGTQ